MNSPSLPQNAFGTVQRCMNSRQDRTTMSSQIKALYVRNAGRAAGSICSKNFLLCMNIPRKECNMQSRVFIKEYFH